MTDAEREFLELAFARASNEWRPRDGVEPDDVSKAGMALARERSTPEAKARYMALREAQWKADRAFEEFGSTLPRFVISEWYREWSDTKKKSEAAN